jgi:hypothetical protein
MTERFTGIPKDQKFAPGGASGRERTRQNPRDTANPFANRREQTGSARENIHNLYTQKQEWLHSMRGGETRPIEEIRDILRRQEIRQELADMSAFSARLDEKLFGKKQEASAGRPEEGEEHLTIGQLVLAIIAGMLSSPADIAEQTAKDAQEQAKMAA